MRYELFLTAVIILPLAMIFFHTYINILLPLFILIAKGVTLFTDLFLCGFVLLYRKIVITLGNGLASNLSPISLSHAVDLVPYHGMDSQILIFYFVQPF